VTFVLPVKLVYTTIASPALPAAVLPCKRMHKLFTQLFSTATDGFQKEMRDVQDFISLHFMTWRVWLGMNQLKNINKLSCFF